MERYLADTHLDFTARYMAACSLKDILCRHPDLADERTINAVKTLLADPGPCQQTQGFFLYKKAAGALLDIVLKARNTTLSAMAFSTMRDSLRQSTGARHMAVTEAIGSLPLHVRGPALPGLSPGRHLPSVDMKDVLAHFNARITDTKWIGRSLVVQPQDPTQGIVVIKTARATESVDSLHNESVWQEYLRKNMVFPVRFDVPKPVKIKESRVFRLLNPPAGPSDLHFLRGGLYSICFMAHWQYFTYINEPLSDLGLTTEEFHAAICQNALLLGRLASYGIIHTAPIPLFHNRVQRMRRQDRGLYEWWRRGRLDRWLDSCRYPNLGVTGIRDLEHMISFRGTARQLYRHIGTHLLSLLLVCASYYRNLDPGKRGYDTRGKPVDARHLFHRKSFDKGIGEIFYSYFKGFTGNSSKPDIPFDLSILAERMVDEMGVDRYMDEVLRIQDQLRMSDREFRNFLIERGYGKEKISSMERGREEIILHTGPHLGEFNRGISIPEMIEATGSMAALCVADRFSRNNLKW